MLKRNDENKYGMTVIERYKIVPTDSLKINQDYQRIKDLARVANVKKSMIKCGQFLPDKCLTVNQNDEIVDGQHRYWAAREIGWEKIPITKYYFNNKENEAAFFAHINGFDQRLKSPDYWYALYLSGDDLAKFLYRLEESPMSALNEKIAVKGKLTEKTKWNIGKVLQVVNVAMERYDTNWKKAEHHIMIEKLRQFSVEVVVDRVNEFVYWFQKIFGEKKDNTLVYYRDSFRAILFFYSLLYRKGWHNKPETISKMKQFRVDQNFITSPLIGKKQILVSHYNGKKKNNTLEWAAIK